MSGEGRASVPPQLLQTRTTGAAGEGRRQACSQDSRNSSWGRCGCGEQDPAKLPQWKSNSAPGGREHWRPLEEAEGCPGVSPSRSSGQRYRGKGPEIIQSNFPLHSKTTWAKTRKQKNCFLGPLLRGLGDIRAFQSESSCSGTPQQCPFPLEP